MTEIGRFLIYVGGGMLLGLALFMLAIVIHELGHVLFGKISGYGFASFSIGRLTLSHNHNQWRVYLRPAMGNIGGQALMIPPAYRPGHFPFKLYNYGGAILNSCFLIVSILLVWMTDSFELGLALSVFALGNLNGLINALPIVVAGLPTDGKNVRYLKDNQAAQFNFYAMLQYNALSQQGMDIMAMPDELFQKPQATDLTNPFIFNQVGLYLEKLVRQFLLGQEVDLIAEIEYYLPRTGALPDFYRLNFINDSLFWLALADEKTEWVAAEFQKPDYQKFAKTMPVAAVYRTKALLELLATDPKAKETLAAGLRVADKMAGQENEKLLLEQMPTQYLHWRERLQAK